MTSASRLYRLAVGLGSFGLLITVGALTAAASRTSFALPAPTELVAACRGVLPSALTISAVAVLALAALGTAVLARAIRSAVHQLASGWRLRRALPVVRADSTTIPFTVVADETPQAFCAGYVRPRVYVSTGALDRLSPAQLLAVLGHEEHHRLRRDPLRLLVVTALADALFFIPTISRLAGRYRELSELAADEAATRATDAPTLANALLVFSRRPAPETVVGIAPERVDHLLGATPAWRLPVSVFVGAAVSLAGIGAATLGVVSLASGTVDLAGVLGRGCMLLMCGSVLALAVVSLSLSRLKRRSVGVPLR